MRRSRAFAVLSVAAVLAGAAACDDNGGPDVAAEAQREALSEGSETLTQGTRGDQTPTAPVTTGQEAPQVVEIPAAEQGLAFAKERATARAGVVTLRMPNPASVEHNIAVDQPERQRGDVVPQGGVSEITVDFPAGSYEYYCSVPGHREAGMVGTLVVR